MSAVSTYKISYHFEQSGRISGVPYSDYVQAAVGDYNSIKTVLTNNSKLRLGTLVIDSVQEVGHGDTVIA